jgi:hypothetical protein
MKLVKGLIVTGVAVAMLTGCGAKQEPAATQAAGAAQTDVVTTASIVNEIDPLVNALGENGNWIVAILNDMTVDKELVVNGEFHDKGDAAKDVYRKLALYAQDADHNITASYTLTVPQLTVKSPNFRIQGGTVKGDVRVEANGFNLHESASVDGNIFFANDEVKASAKIDGKVTGAQEVK